MNLPTDKVLAVIPTDDPSPVAYMNLYEPGDVWVKVQGCESCPPDAVRHCCGRCPHRMDAGCQWHFEGRISAKPHVCVVEPSPVECRSFCQLVYKCVKGSHLGHFRYTCDVRDKMRTCHGTS